MQLTQQAHGDEPRRVRMSCKAETDAIRRTPGFALADFLEQQARKVFPLQQETHVRLVKIRMVDQAAENFFVTGRQEVRNCFAGRRSRGLRIGLKFNRHE